LEDLGIDGMMMMIMMMMMVIIIIIIIIIIKSGWRAWTGLLRLRIRTGGGRL
jgi:hypothetical protein